MICQLRLCLLVCVKKVQLKRASRRIMQLCWRPFSFSSVGTGQRGVGTSTIFARSTAAGKSAVAVIRVSGPAVKHVICQMTQTNEKVTALPRPRQASLRKIIDPETCDQLDKGLVLYFPGPASFTGEDICEFHVHGGPAVISAILKSLGRLPGLRPAVPGEFTKRAFFNGKLDLTEVEGMSDLICAETEAQRKQALQQMEGMLHKLYDGWSTTLKKCLANVEAFIDFGEDQNIEEGILDSVVDDIQKLHQVILQHLADNRRGELLRGGVRAVILGKPNVGKSSLFNILCQREAAIVSPAEGTTRDVLDTVLDIGGYPAVLSDTAGLRESGDVIEQEGVKRARHRASEGDLLLVILDAKALISIGNGRITSSELHKRLQICIKELGVLKQQNSRSSEQEYFAGVMQTQIVILNKSDLLIDTEEQKLKSLMQEIQGINWCIMSCKTMAGFDAFLHMLQRCLEEICGSSQLECPVISQERHRHHLSKCMQNLSQFLTMINRDVVIAAEELRQSLAHVGQITGRVTSEEILDIIFKEFCIGK